MNKQEIQKLIKQQEQRDQEFLVRGEKRAEQTEIIFNKIKDRFLEEAIKHAITMDYRVSSRNIVAVIYKCLIEECSFPVDANNIKIDNLLSMPYINTKRDNADIEASNFLESFSYFLLEKNLGLHLVKNGFTEDLREFKTSKEKLLRLSTDNNHTQNSNQEVDKDNGHEAALTALGFVILIGLIFFIYVSFN